MVVKDEISKREIDFVNLCQDHNVKYIYAFGSSTNDRFNSETSDIDLLLEIEVTDPVEMRRKVDVFVG
ncbi:MAG: nucleotidyltransferase domain-containing protein [Lentimicrobium sp.]